MGHVRVVTDSIADIPAGMATELAISVAPCLLYVGDRVYRDGVDLTPERLYEMLAHGRELPRTTQPAVSDLAAIYRRLLAESGCEAVVSVHVGSIFSGAVNAASAAAQTLPDPSQVEVIDSGQLSMGEGWAAIEAGRMARAGATRGEIGKAVRALLPRLRVGAMIDTLENLYRGGRIKLLSAALGTMLQVKPLLRVQSGEVTVWNKVRTRTKALGQLVGEIRSWGPLAELAVLHTGAEELAQTLAGTLRDLVPDREMIVEPAGAALATHLGLGAVGACALLQTGPVW